MADYDRYRDDERGYERGRQWNRAERENDFSRNSLDDRNGYGVGSGGGGLDNDRSYGNYGGGGGDYDMPSYGRGGQNRSFSQNQGSGRDQASPRGGTYAYGAGDSARGYRREYDPYLDRNDRSDNRESRDFNPYRGEFGGGDRGRGYGDQAAHHEEHRGFWEKARDEVSSWMGDHEALRRRQEDMQPSHSGKGPKGYRRSDERIRDEVSDRLTDDHWLDASDIEVRVENGEVTLTGTVSDRESKRRAERLAESASGVSDVQNNIKVKRAADASGADASSQASTMGINTTLDDQAAGRA